MKDTYNKLVFYVLDPAFLLLRTACIVRLYNDGDEYEVKCPRGKLICLQGSVVLQAYRDSPAANFNIFA